MKELVSKSFVQVYKGKRKYKLYPEDLKKIYKINKKLIPIIPKYSSLEKSIPITDIEEDIDENISSK